MAPTSGTARNRCSTASTCARRWASCPATRTSANNSNSPNKSIAAAQAAAAKNDEGQLQLAYVELQAGNLPLAEATVSTILHKRPNNAIALALAGLIDYFNGRHEVALTKLKPALVGLGRVPTKAPLVVRLHAFAVVAANKSQGHLGPADPALANVKAQVVRSLPRVEELFELFAQNLKVLPAAPR